MWIPRAARLRQRTAFLAVACLALVVGCGGDEDDSPLAPVENPEETLEANLSEMSTITEAATNEPGNQLLEDPVLQALLDAVGFEPVGPVASVIRGGVSPSEVAARYGFGPSKSGPARPRIAMPQYAGTYDRDVNDTTEPFPGWVLAEANNPNHGYVFRFQLDDDITYWDESSMSEVPVQGEFRLLEIVVEDGGTPLDPNDDYLEHMVVEIAADPTPSPAATLARLELAVNVTNQNMSWTIGSPTANDPGDSGASFVGPLLYFVQLSATLTTSNEATVNAVEQLYHSGERFAARVQTGQTVDMTNQSITSAYFVMAAGTTNDPSVPPLRISMTLSKFRLEGDNEVADVNGTITYQLAPLATLSGDTTEVPVDFDGDGQIDGTCVNVNITFANEPNVTRNICEVGALDGAIVPF